MMMIMTMMTKTFLIYNNVKELDFENDESMRMKEMWIMVIMMMMITINEDKCRRIMMIIFEGTD